MKAPSPPPTTHKLHVPVDLQTRADVLLARAARRNTALFAKAWLEGIDPAPHQFVMARRFDTGHRFQIDLWPRDHGKSAMIMAYILRRVCENPNVRALIVQKTATEAEKTLAVIKRELEENTALAEFYRQHWLEKVGHAHIANVEGQVSLGGGRKTGAWQSARIYVKRRRSGKDPTVEAVGVGGAITGGHFDIIVLDDVEDDENTRTEGRMRWIRDWFDGTIMHLREPHTKMIVIGTMKTAGPDLYNHLLKNPAWDALVVPAILSHDPENIEVEYIRDDDGIVTGVKVLTPDVRVLWPQKWPIEALMYERIATSDPAIWRREKMNDPRAMGGAVFRREWIQVIDPDQAPPWDECYQTIQAWDTAWDESEGAAWSACLTMGVHKGKVYVYGIWRARLDMPDLLTAAQERYREWKPREVVIEDAASGRALLKILRRETPLPVVPVSPAGRSKEERARAITPYMGQGRVVFVRGPFLADMLDELALFPRGRSADMVDALAHGVSYVMSGGDGIHI